MTVFIARPQLLTNVKQYTMYIQCFVVVHNQKKCTCMASYIQIYIHVCRPITLSLSVYKRMGFFGRFWNVDNMYQSRVGSKSKPFVMGLIHIPPDLECVCE